ncbi:MAG: SPOR domain-containing protein [Dongiaceae bacterium]
MARCAAALGLLLLISAPLAADYAAGLAAFNRKDFTHAFSEWIEAAKAGDAHAQHGLGMLYELGQGVPYSDAKAAAEWYQKSAAQNYAPAINNLARLYADGRGVTQDLSKAIELWSRAAEAGNVTARFNMGLQYANGSGVPKDPKKAAEYLLRAAEGGLAEAQFAIAGFYRDGTGVEKDVEAARLWYNRAATAGFESARAELAALDKPAISAAPAVDNADATPLEPASKQQAQDQKTETPPQQPETSGTKTAPDPADGQPQVAVPAETQQPATPPAEEPKKPKATQATQATEAPADATAAQPAAQDESATPAEDPTASANAAEQPAVGEGSPAMNSPDPNSDLPLAESLTGDAQVYRVWLYSSGQENDARSYWEKLNQQYPRLLGGLELDLRRYFLGEARGSVYRVFAGPFENLSAAQKTCEDLRTRFGGDQFCRPVLN